MTQNCTDYVILLQVGWASKSLNTSQNFSAIQCRRIERFFFSRIIFFWNGSNGPETYFKEIDIAREEKGNFQYINFENFSCSTRTFNDISIPNFSDNE